MDEKLTQGQGEQVGGYGDVISQAMLELDYLRKESQRLSRVNILHKRLAAMLDVGAMIEAFSVWLMPYVAHELVGCANFIRNKNHFFCSCHGPQRKDVLSFARKVVGMSDRKGKTLVQDGFFAHCWGIETVQNTGVLLVVKKEQGLSDSELELINDSLAVLVDSIQRGIEYETLFEQASSDPLTGLGNRKYFTDRIVAMMDRSKRYGRPLCMISIDLDYFKDVNDTFGHLVGDETLCRVASTLKSCVRKSDLLVRMGGDEFVIVLDDTDLDAASALATRITAEVAGLDIRISAQKRVGLSMGLSLLQKDEGLEAWLDRTDDILYRAKATGRGRFCK